MQLNLDEFLSHTTQNESTGCLEWTRCLATDGYPRAYVGKNSNAKVHRLVWALANDADPTGKVIRHSCDNPKCINPGHLLLGTPADNMRDRDTRERHGAAKLSHTDVKAIRLLYESKLYTQKALAKMYGVDSRTVNSLVNRKHFKHV